MRPLTIADQARLHGTLARAERMAAYALATIRGRTAEEVAAEVAARVFAALRSKAQPEARSGDVEP